MLLLDTNQKYKDEVHTINEVTKATAASPVILLMLARASKLESVLFTCKKGEAEGEG